MGVVSEDTPPPDAPLDPDATLTPGALQFRRCHQHQHPEEYGRDAIPEPTEAGYLKRGDEAIPWGVFNREGLVPEERG